MCHTGTCSAEIRTRIASAMAAMVGLNKLAKQHNQLYKLVQVIRVFCYLKFIPISFLKNGTNDWVRSKINFPVGQQKLLATVKRLKLAWFEHVTCHENLSKIILQGTLEGGRRRGPEKICWTENVKEWTLLLMPDLLTRAFYRKDWKKFSAESSLMPAPRSRPVKGLTKTDIDGD